VSKAVLCNVGDVDRQFTACLGMPDVFLGCLYRRCDRRTGFGEASQPLYNHLNNYMSITIRNHESRHPHSGHRLGTYHAPTLLPTHNNLLCYSQPVSARLQPPSAAPPRRGCQIEHRARELGCLREVACLVRALGGEMES